MFPPHPGRKPFNGFRMYGVECLAKDDAKDDFKDDFKDSEWLATSFYVTICQ
jgi:hypothetical protein